MADPGFMEKLVERYPGFTWVTSFPELSDLLQKAVAAEWSPDLLEAQLRNTNWWKTTNPAQRSWVALEQTDGAQAGALVDASKRQIATMAAQLGTEIDDGLAGALAWRSRREGWDNDMLQQQVAAHLRPGAGSVANVKAMAKQWMVDISDDQAAEYTRRIFTGTMTNDGLTGLFGQLAQARFPYLADQIKVGIAPGDYFNSYRTMIAKMTDQTPEQVDLMGDPQWQPVISHVDEKSGQIRAMTLNEAQRHLRSTQAYASSRTGQAEVADFTDRFERILGTRA